MLNRHPGEGATAPVSFTQEGYWLLSRLLPTDSSYNLRGGLRLRGALDVEALRRALTDLATRHEILRTTYRENGSGVPVQVVGGLPATVLEEVDLQDIGCADREASARRLALAEAARPIDLFAGPVRRVLLLRLSPTEHWLIDICHHIAVDWLSGRIADWELRTLYWAHATGKSASLPPLRMQYREYAAREREHVDDPSLHSALRYWEAKLTGAPGGPRVSPEYRDASAGGLEVATVTLSLPHGTMSRLTALARTERTTPFVATLAAWASTLLRYTGQDDIVMISDVSTRVNRDLEAMIGLLANALALRVQTGGNVTFRELIARVRRTVMESIVHGVPFQRIVEVSGSGRDWGWDWKQLSHMGFIVHPSGPEWSRPGSPAWPLDTTNLEIPNDQSHVELNMHLSNSSDDWWADLIYRRRTMPAEAASRLGNSFVKMLESASLSPDLPVARLDCGA
jgi:hypothetical protein